MFSKKLASLKKGKDSISKKKEGDDASTSYFEKAKILFPLDKRAEMATEGGWKTYIANRTKAENTFHGPRNEKRAKSVTDEEEELIEGEEYGDFGEIQALNLIRENMTIVEEDMELDEGTLSKSFRLLSCDALFEEEYEPRTMTTLTRIYSPTRPVYIDVHFQYHCRSRYDSVEWYYTLGFKIYNHPGTNDYHPSEIKKFERGCFDRAYSGNGWRSIAYGFYDDCDDYREDWVKVENARFVLGEDDVKDVYEALWGPLDDIQGDDEEEEMERRSKMVNTVRVLMAAACIGYVIAIEDDERDEAGQSFMLEGLSDRWFARGVRKACGFQLANDPENEKEGLKEREEEMKGDDDDDEFDSDDERMYNEDDYF